jgi:hypothetical protein
MEGFLLGAASVAVLVGLGALVEASQCFDLRVARLLKAVRRH